MVSAASLNPDFVGVSLHRNCIFEFVFGPALWGLGFTSSTELAILASVIYPNVLDPSKVGTYPATAKSGGGYVWDEVLEYRVWCHPEHGAEDLDDGNDYYYPFETFEEALEFSNETTGAEAPIALVLQREFIDEPEPGVFVHVARERIAEWHVEFLSRPRRDERTLPDFFAPDAPANRLDIIRGLAPRPGRES